MALDPVPDELKHSKNFEKVLISNRILITEIPIMHGKSDFLKLRETFARNYKKNYEKHYKKNYEKHFP